MTPPEKDARPEKARQKAAGKEALVPPQLIIEQSAIPCPFSGRANEEGVVTFQAVSGIPNGLIAVAMNIKVEYPETGATHTAHFDVQLSKEPLARILFDRDDSLFREKGAFWKDNVTVTATADVKYTDGGKCVVGLDPPCVGPDQQKSEPLDPVLNGRGVNVKATLPGYAPEEPVSGHFVLILGYVLDCG